MSFLTPLYLLGALAVAAPIVFHLIRRSPRGEVPFSSLMFLAPTPPRLTRRSRLENWLLLLLRAAALCLLVLAFARPFLRQAARLDLGDADRRRVAVLLDTSASMRRGDLWAQAKARADEVIAGLRPGDQVAVFAFDATSRPLLGFEESATLDPARRQAVARGLVDRLTPTWGSTNLGQALIDAVAAIEDVADASEKAGRMPRRVVLVSDLQQGSRLDALGDFEWPSDVELELRTVADNRPNATVQWLADAPGSGQADADRPPRVRVTNNPDSRQERFELAWLDERGVGLGKPVDVYVPPGESRVVRVPPPSGRASASSLRLKGDAHGFDNTVYLAAERKGDATVVYLGKDAAGDPAGLLYYLERAFPDTPGRGVRVRAHSPAEPLAWEPGQAVPLVVLATDTTAENVVRLGSFVREGGTLLDVLAAPGRATTLAALANTPPPEIEEARVDRDILLGEIAFDHPLFAPLAGPQFNDFTKIHFWKYRRLPKDALGEARILARFENGDPALAEKTIGKGRIVVLTSGWSPADSQLARSSKFVPLMMALLEGPGRKPLDATNLLVHDRVPLPTGSDASKGLAVRKPDGARVAVEPGGTSFAGTDQPGIYTLDAPDGPRPFAVNLDPAEGRTAPMHVETLEQLGCRLASRAPKAADAERRRQMLNAELEGRQKLWRALVLAAVGTLIVETWLAGRLAMPRSARAEALPT
jgi:hypothetical protein